MQFDITLERATLDALSTIRDLAHEIWHDHYPSIIGMDQVNFMLANLYSESKLAEQIRSGEQIYFLIKEGEECLGFLSFSTSLPEILKDRKQANAGFIHKFYILSSCQGKGIGKYAFQQLCQSFPDSQNIRLQVNRKNIKAINFYFSLGFRIETAQDFSIGEGYNMEDFIMLWRRN